MIDYNDNNECDMVQEIKDSRAERDAPIPMPKMTTTDKLMSPGPNDEVEG